ncbi:hypothetical protein Pse7367_2838 [Thalassoporum mexicanum PCC 7367]|uniref:hypothetical protein n=1 Tax=Thalassoporum mexicanum TaxID=3457544 RepID=UPI00029FE3B4|nr:hypothetical protein [Pseudanabaena sp. PCC 7367]AFY71091.1 hypothetical protein Pse7367_2838 [Pseudanabaena sp. PCC 7367]
MANQSSGAKKSKPANKPDQRQAAKLEFRDRVLAQLGLVATVTARAMFGGY